MAPCMICFIFLHLFLLSNAHYDLTVHPANPVVALGGSVQLNCSINCPLGRTSWKGLDTNLNGQYIAPGYSVQTIENASFAMEGTRICVGTCPGIRKNLQASVYLYVYALPQSLLLNYSMRNGMPYLHCSVKDIYPPDIIPPKISCYRWSKRLDEPTEEKVENDGESLTTVTWSWEIGDEDWISGTEYKCEALVLLGDHMLKREGTLKISTKVETSTTFAASSTPQTRGTSSRHLETSYIATSTDHHTIPGMQERNKHITILDKDMTNTVTQNNKANTLRTTMSSLGTQKIVLSTRIHRTDFPHKPITSQGVPEPDTLLSVTQTMNKDGLSLVLPIASAAGLALSILLSLQMWKHLHRKGFFQPKQIHCSGVNEDTTLQDPITSLQAVYSPNASTKMKYTMY